MIDQDLKEQLKAVFQKLETEITLVVNTSTHEKQEELLRMLQDLTECSAHIRVRQETQVTAYPQFHLEHKGVDTGIRFNGIPGGHEFTSLVLAILNADGKGKLPDAGILERMANLQGPIELETYVSLSCENCPEVIQALNLMALTHKEFRHTMIDGEFVQEDIQRLGIQGVPSVIHQGKLVHSGKASLIELLTKLEEHFGKKEAQARDLGTYDVVVLGSGPAGASAAIYSARKGLKTAIIAEKVGGQVQDTKGIENLISQKYTEGPKLAAELMGHMRDYPIEILEHRRVKTIEKGTTSFIELESGEKLQAKSLIVATGAKWRNLNIPGEKEYLGRGVAYCPHCDGPYFKGKDIAVVGGGNSGVEAAIDLAGIVKSVTLVEFAGTLKADQVLVEKLKSLPNVKILVNARTTQVEGDATGVTALVYEDRESGEIRQVAVSGIFVQIGLVPNSSFLKDVVELNKFGEVVIDAKCRTSAPGIYAAGDVTTVPFKQIIIAMGEGAKAGLTSFEELMMKA